jgi:excisionase family DNA binding protein
MSVKCDDEGPEGQLMTADDVARLLRCSKRHIYRLTDSNRMPSPVRLGNLVRWRRNEIDRWINDGCRPDSVRTR